MNAYERMSLRFGRRALAIVGITAIVLFVIAPPTQAQSGMCVEYIGEICIRRPPPKKRIVSQDARQEYLLGITHDGKRIVQRALFNLKYRFGPIDGKFGPLTRGAMRRWQASAGQKSTGYLTEPQFAWLVSFQNSLETAQFEEWRRSELKRIEREQEAWSERQRRLTEAEYRLWKRGVEAKHRQFRQEADASFRDWDREMQLRRDRFLHRR